MNSKNEYLFAQPGMHNISSVFLRTTSPPRPLRGLVQRAKSVMGFEDSDEDSGDEFDNDEAGEWKPMGNYGKARNLKSINLGDGRKTKSGRRKTRALASHESVGAFSLSELMMTDADDSESGSRKGSMMSRGSCSSAGRRPTIDPGFTPSAVAAATGRGGLRSPVRRRRRSA